MKSRAIKIASVLIILLFAGPFPSGMFPGHEGGMSRNVAAEGTVRTLTKDADFLTGPGGSAQLEGTQIESGGVHLNITNVSWSQDRWSNGTVVDYSNADGIIPYSVNSSLILKRNTTWRQISGPITVGYSMIWDPYNGRPVILDSAYQYNSELRTAAYYDSTISQWRPLPMLPGFHQHPKLFWNNRTKEIIAIGATYSTADATLWTFNVTNGVWKERSGFNQDSWGAGYCWNDEAGQLLIYGGSIDSKDGSISGVGTYLYDYRTDTYSRRADGLKSRLYSLCFWDHLHQRFIVHGGRTPSGQDVIDTAVYYPSNDTWVKIGTGPAMYETGYELFDPWAESYYLVTAGTQKIWAYNLTTGTFKVITNRTTTWTPSVVWDPVRSRMISFDKNVTNGMEVIQSWNPRTKLWDKLGTKPYFMTGYTSAYDARREIVYYTGGLWGGYTANSFWGFNVTTGQWMNLSTVSPLPTMMSWHSMVYDEVGDQMIFFGGIQGTAVYSLQLANLTWNALSPMPTSIITQCPVWVPENRTIMMLTAANPMTGITYFIQYDVAADKWSLDNMLNYNLNAVFGAWNPDGGFAIFYGGNANSIYWADNDVSSMYYYYLHNKSLVLMHPKYGPGLWRLPYIAAAGSEWDPLGNRMIIIGGTDYEGMGSGDPTYCTRMFAYYPTNSTIILIEASSIAGYQKAFDRLQWDARHNRMLLMGGWTGDWLQSTTRDVWALDSIFKPSGMMDSRTIDTGGNLKLFNLSWEGQAPPLAGGVPIRFQLAANADNISWAYVGPDCTSRTYYTVPGTPVCREQIGMRYLRYRLLLTTENSTVSPIISRVSIEYQQYKATGSYLSPAIDLIENGVDLLTVSWKDVIPGGTAVTMKVATSKLPERTNITSWYSVSKAQTTFTFKPSRYLWFEASLGTSDLSVTPELTELSVNFNRGISLDTASLDRLVTTPFIPVSFSIRYTDPDNDRPYTANVFVNDIPYQMTCDDGPTSQGVMCYYNGTFMSGVYMHYFNFSDGRRSKRVPDFGVVRGPFVNDPARLQEGLIDPAMGTTEDDISIKVKYLDLEGTFPYRKAVVVDGTDHDMNFTKGDPKTGAFFVFIGKFPVGYHHYHFEFNDSLYDTRYPATGEFQGPEIEASGTVVIKGVVPGKNLNESERLHVSAATLPDLEASGIPVTYAWYLDGKAVGEGKSLDLALTAGSHVLKVLASTKNQQMESHLTVKVVHQNKQPVARLTVVKTLFMVGETLTIDGTGSWDPDGNVTDYIFTFGDGSSPTGAKDGKAGHKYSKEGTFNISLVVKDNEGKESVNPAYIRVHVQKANIRTVPGPEAGWTLALLLAVAVILWDRDMDRRRRIG